MPTQLTDSPLAKDRVQWTLVCVVMLAIVGMRGFSGRVDPQHNATVKMGEPAQLRIDLNTADSRELVLLPGVGPVLAKRIIENRDRLGQFQSVDDLDRVHGIGQKTIARWSEICEIREPETGGEKRDL